MLKAMSTLCLGAYDPGNASKYGKSGLGEIRFNGWRIDNNSVFVLISE